MLPVCPLHLMHWFRPTFSLTLQSTILVQNNKLPCMAEKTVHSLADAGIGEIVKDHHVGVEAVGAELHHLYDRVWRHHAVNHTESLHEDPDVLPLLDGHPPVPWDLPGFQRTKCIQDLFSLLLTEEKLDHVSSDLIWGPQVTESNQRAKFLALPLLFSCFLSFLGGLWQFANAPWAVTCQPHQELLKPTK